jgi:RNA polymerase sigma-70 factor (ECF subfamily)
LGGEERLGLTELAAENDVAQSTKTRGSEELELRLEQHRVELTAYAYRMLGSSFEAEDAVQETLLRAWRSFEGFEGRAALRSWLYRIATNVCLDMLNGKERRARPMDLAPPKTADRPLGEPLAEGTWVLPIPDARVLPSGGDPAEVAESRETIRLAFVAALQLLPPRQRAVLILREVLGWKASEVAELLDSTVASVNSALQRARSTLAATDVAASDAYRPMDDEQRALLARYVDAFERYDMDSLTSLLREDATWSMPPYELWLRSHDDIRRWCLGPGIGCRGSRLIPLVANGSPAFGQYKPSEAGGLEPWSLQVLEVSAGRIAGISFFLDTERLFPVFGLPPRLEAMARRAERRRPAPPRRAVPGARHTRRAAGPDTRAAER